MKTLNGARKDSNKLDKNIEEVSNKTGDIITS